MISEEAKGPSHLKPEVWKTLAWPTENRIFFNKEDRFVLYPAAIRALDCVNQILKAPTRLRPDNLCISGMPGAGKSALAAEIEREYPVTKVHGNLPVATIAGMPGMGKTALTEQIIARHRSRSTLEFEARPVVRIVVPAGGKGDLVTALLIELGYDPERLPLNISIRQGMVLNAFKKCHTKGLVLDDINNLYLAQSGGITHSSWEVLKYIRWLSDVLKIKIIFTGDESAPQIIREEPSLKSRMRLLTLTPWKDGPELAEFNRDFEATLSLKEESCLSKRATTSLIYRLGYGIDSESKTGRLDNMIKIIIEASVIALGGGREHITQDDLESAANDLEDEIARDLHSNKK